MPPTFSDDDRANLELPLEEGATGLEEEDTRGTAEISEPFDPSLIRVETKTLTISLLLTRIEQAEINLSPGFQRKGGIWTAAAQSRLIESMLIRIPLPAFYMDGTDDDEWLVVDGLQRLTALRKFVVDQTLTLQGLEFLKKLNDKRFRELPRNFQRRIVETQVTVFVIQEKTPPEVKFNIFKRINTGGLPLSPQEIRHALYQGPAADLLEALAQSPEFQRATAHGVRDDRMGDRECILRAIAFMLSPPRDYKASELDAFLNRCMVDINQMRPSQITALTSRFRRVMGIAYRIFGNRAFRKQYPERERRFPINKALFETWSVTIDALTADESGEAIEARTELQKRFARLLEGDAEFDSAISVGTGDVRKVRYRFAKIETLVREVLDA